MYVNLGSEMMAENEQYYSSYQSQSIGKVMAENKIQIQDDEPLSSANLFNFDDYAEALKGIIIQEETKTPLVVGIFGEWGSGKTSLMRTIQKKLEKTTSAKDTTKIKTVWFNAWEQSYAQANNFIGPSLLYCIYQELGGKKSKYEELGRGILGIVGEIGTRKFLGMELKEIQNKFDSTTQSRKNFSETFESAIEDYCKNEKCDRVIIFIDDLDRCLPDKAVEILESIKLFLNAKRCIFILGMDREIITESIRVHYKDFISVSSEYKNSFTGEAYLEKIIQLHFQLPPIGYEDLKDFIEDLPIPKEFYKPYLGMIIEGIGNNPCKIKRFMNAIEFQRNLSEHIPHIKEVKKKSGKIFDALLIEWQILNSSSNQGYIKFREGVSKNSGLLLKMHKHIDSGRPEGLPPELQPFWSTLIQELIKAFPFNDKLKEDDIEVIKIITEVITEVIHLSSVTGTAKLSEEGLDIKSMNRRKVIDAIREKKSLEGEDLSLGNLEGLDLSNMNLRKANLFKANLSGAKLIKADLSEADLLGANLVGAYLTNAILKEAKNLSQVDFKGAKLNGADLSETDLSGIDLSEADLSGFDLTKVKLVGADLSHAKLRGAHLKEAIEHSGLKLDKIKLVGVDLSDEDLSEIDFSGLDLTKAKFIGRKTNLYKAIFRNAILTEANLTGANLTEASLTWANLTGANLTEANLTEANIVFAKLNDADLSGATLIGIDAVSIEEVNDKTNTKKIILADKKDNEYEAKIKRALESMDEKLKIRILEDNEDLKNIYNTPDKSAASSD